MKNANRGWIKLHRKITEKGYYRKSQYVHLWVHLLLTANHKKKEFMFNDTIIVIKEGQILTGREQLSADTGISESTVERILKMLENEHQIEQQKTTKYRVITILHWREYQFGGHQNGQQLDNKRTTSGQQADTNKNDKNAENVKNDKKVRTRPKSNPVELKSAYGTFSNVLISDKEYGSLITRLGNEQRVKSAIEILSAYKESSGKKYKSDYATFHTWVISELEKRESANGTTNSSSRKSAATERATFRHTEQTLNDNRELAESLALRRQERSRSTGPDTVSPGKT